MTTLHDGVTGDDWREAAQLYKKLTFGVTMSPITVMLDRMNAMLPFSQATGIYDNGTGPGSVITRVISDYGSSIPPSASLSCSDFSGPMIEQVHKSQAEEVAKDSKSPWNRLDAQVRNAMDLEGVLDESQSHVTAGFVYFMTPDPQKCLSESRRVLQPDGVLCCSSWVDSEWMNLMRLVEKIRPGILMPAIPEEWRSVAALRAELEKAGFRDVNAEEVEVTMEFGGHDAFVDVLLTKMPAMANLVKDFSEEESTRLEQLVLEGLQQVAPEQPGSMRGTALVAIGRK